MRKLLFPLSIIYSLIIFIRNKCFDLNILKSQSFNFPIISIGNITVGGTGKTPHTEYLISLLQETYKPAVLSRGYKRKTSDFREVEIHSTVSEVGDEPLQMKKKYPNIVIAVDKDRVNGVNNLLKKEDKPNIILLDDAFQHRHIQAGINILLIDYNRPIDKDWILPAGNLREPAHNRKRANVVILTKCPKTLKPIDFKIKQKELNLYPYQNLFFTTFRYKKLVNIFSTDDRIPLIHFKGYTAIVVTSIASTQPIYNKITEEGLSIEKIAFPDHHTFTKNDFVKIKNTFDKVQTDKKIIICTEKDVEKLKDIANCSDEYNNLPIYYLPIEIEFLNDSENKFNLIINKFIGQFLAK